MTDIKENCERSEQHSRAQQVNETKHHKNQRSYWQQRSTQDPTRIHKAIIEYQFQEIFLPHWFGSVQWQPFITDYISVVREARHFRNKFLCALLNTKPNKIPNPPERPRIIWFHEKAPVCINPQEPHNPRFKIAFHTHFHLEDCPAPYDSWIQLDWLIRHQVAKGFHRFSTSNSSKNTGFVLKPWIREHHANYNFKDYYQFKHHQDSDLVLDIENSDLSFSMN